MIKPTNGRIVWFTPSPNAEAGLIIHGSDPLAAMIVHVWSDRCVNLVVYDSNGNQHPKTSVRLLQDGDLNEEHGGYAEWMPFQKGQAAKTEALEAAARP